MDYDPTCETPWIVDCDCDTCRGYVWRCPECGESHFKDLDECNQCDWVAEDHAEWLMRDCLIDGKFEAAANCWLHTKYANTSLETKLTEINKTGGDVLMCHLREIAKLAFVAALEESK